MPPLSSDEVVHVLKIDFRVMDPNSEMPADVSYGPSLLTTCWIFAAVATVIVTLRLVTRITSAGHLSADDYFMTVSLVSQTPNLPTYNSSLTSTTDFSPSC